MNPEPPAADETARNFPTLIEMRIFAERLLARREYAVLELQTRLLKKWSGKWPGEDQIGERVAELITALQADGALSDERFTESFIRSRRAKFQGPAKIMAELRQRRVPEVIIAAKLEPDADEWTELAAGWAARQCSGPLDYAGRAKYYRRLINRGFSHQQAMDALSGQPESPH